MDNQITLLVLAAIGILGVVVAAAIKAVTRDRRAPLPDARLDQLSRQVAALQQSVDATAVEVERLGEGLRFTAKLLAERSRADERRGGEASE